MLSHDWCTNILVQDKHFAGGKLKFIIWLVSQKKSIALSDLNHRRFALITLQACGSLDGENDQQGKDKVHLLSLVLDLLQSRLLRHPNAFSDLCSENHCYAFQRLFLFLFTSFLTQKLNQYKKDVFTVKTQICGITVSNVWAKVSTVVPNE